MDIKNIATGVGLVITIAGLFVFQGQLISRVDTLEKVTAPDTSIIEQDITQMKSDIEVLKTKINRIENPLGN